VANGPNIFQMLLVSFSFLFMIIFCYFEVSQIVLHGVERHV